MTPRRLDRQASQAKLELIQELLDDLEPLRGVTLQRVREDRLTRYAIERILGQLVELAVAVNGHLAVALLGRAPTEYRASFVLAVEAGVISQELADALKPSVGLRNVLTHEYVATDLTVVVGSVGPALDGYREYVRQVARFLMEES